MIRLPFQEFLEEVLKEGPKNCTWMETSNWLTENYTGEQIAKMNKKLYLQLCIFTPDDTDEEDPAADPLRDAIDSFWRAGDDELNQKALTEALEEETRQKETK